MRELWMRQLNLIQMMRARARLRASPQTPAPQSKRLARPPQAAASWGAPLTMSLVIVNAGWYACHFASLAAANPQGHADLTEPARIRRAGRLRAASVGVACGAEKKVIRRGRDPAISTDGPHPRLEMRRSTGRFGGLPIIGVGQLVIKYRSGAVRLRACSCALFSGTAPEIGSVEGVHRRPPQCHACPYWLRFGGESSLSRSEIPLPIGADDRYDAGPREGAANGARDVGRALAAWPPEVARHSESALAHSAFSRASRRRLAPRPGRTPPRRGFAKGAVVRRARLAARDRPALQAVLRGCAIAIGHAVASSPACFNDDAGRVDAVQEPRS